MISTVVSDSPNKLFVAGLPNYLNDEQVKVKSLSKYFLYLTIYIQQFTPEIVNTFFGDGLMVPFLF